MTVYIVTSGEYSDYSIVAACETETQAKIYCAIHEDSLDCPQIVELETEDVGTSRAPVMMHWIVNISSDGQILSKQSRYTIKNRDSVICKGRDGWRNFIVYEVCFTVSEGKGDDVIEKIARDRLAKYKYQKLVDEMEELKTHMINETE